jgi:hypothetical protein
MRSPVCISIILYLYARDRNGLEPAPRLVVYSEAGVDPKEPVAIGGRFPFFIAKQSKVSR